jgi:hypothetical protein
MQGILRACFSAWLRLVARSLVGQPSLFYLNNPLMLHCKSHDAPLLTNNNMAGKTSEQSRAVQSTTSADGRHGSLMRPLTRHSHFDRLPPHLQLHIREMAAKTFSKEHMRRKVHVELLFK